MKEENGVQVFFSSSKVEPVLETDLRTGSSQNFPAPQQWAWWSSVVVVLVVGHGQ